MILKAVVHSDESGGYWAEVPSLPGCFTQGDTLEELKANIQEAIEGWLQAGEPTATTTEQILEVSV